MQHHLVGVVRVVRHVAFTPVISDSICKDGPGTVERGGCDATTDCRVALESVLSVLVPEMECSVATSGTECAVLGVE